MSICLSIYRNKFFFLPCELGPFRCNHITGRTSTGNFRHWVCVCVDVCLYSLTQNIWTNIYSTSSSIIIGLPIIIVMFIVHSVHYILHLMTTLSDINIAYLTLILSQEIIINCCHNQLSYYNKLYWLNKLVVENKRNKANKISLMNPVTFMNHSMSIFRLPCYGQMPSN